LIRRAFVSLLLAALALPAAADAAQPRVHARLDGTLSGPATGAPEDVALRYVRADRAALGLDAGDLDALAPPAVTTAGDITQVRWRQTVDGIPAADSELRVNLARDGRVLNVLGEPAHDLDANTTPLVDAGEAVRAVQDAVGAYRVVGRGPGPAGAPPAAPPGGPRAPTVPRARRSRRPTRTARLRSSRWTPAGSSGASPTGRRRWRSTMPSSTPAADACGGA
jgi:hypothetical protein